MVLAQAAVGRHAWQVDLPSTSSPLALIVRRSANRGRSWASVTVALAPAAEPVTDANLTFVDAAHGWLLVGATPPGAQESWTLYATADGGRTWSAEASTGAASDGQFLAQTYDATAIAFRTPQQGWILAAGTASANPSVDVFRTTDGGRRWVQSEAALPESQAVVVDSVDAPVFTDAEHGRFSVRLGSPSAVLRYHTQDSGATWTTSTTPAMTRARIGSHIWEVDDPLSSSPRLLPIRRSADGGKTWKVTMVSLPSVPSPIDAARLTFADVGHGWLLLASGPATAQEFWALLATADGGRTWSVAARTGSGTFLGLAYGPVAMAFPSPTQGWIVTVDPWHGTPISVDVFRTDDGGLRWQRTILPVPPSDAGQMHGIEAPLFTSAEDGSFVVQVNTGVLRYTTRDGGTTWATSPASIANCASASLAAHGGREGDHTGAFGEVVFTDIGRSPCLLQGMPTSIALLRADGSVLNTRLVASPAEATPVLLEPDAPDAPDAARLVVYWANWCGAAPGPLRIRIALAGGAGAVTAPFDGPPNYDYVPVCLNNDRPSTLRITQAYGAGP